MKPASIELLYVDDAEQVLHGHDFDTIKEAKARAKLLLANPSLFDSAAEIEGWHKQVYQIQLHVGGEFHSGWYPKYYQKDAVTTPYSRC